MTLHFRNVKVDTSASIQTGPREAFVTLIERGTVRHWVYCTRPATTSHGAGGNSRKNYLAYSRPWGVAPLLELTCAKREGG